MILSKKHYIIIHLFSLLLIALMVSCGNRRQEKSNQKLAKKNDKELISSLKTKNEIPFDFLSVRVGVDFKNAKRDASFSVYVKLNVDTAIGGSIKVGPLIIGTYKITTDSIIFVNKRDKCYFAESLDFVSVLFGTAIEFDFFQELILGLAVGFEEKTKYQQISEKDQDHYILSSHKKRDFRRLENDRLNLNRNLVLTQYHLAPKTLDIFQIDIEIPADSTSIEINYIERKLSGEYTVPEETTLEIHNPKDTILIHMNYGTVKIGAKKDIKIKIPDSYIECK